MKQKNKIKENSKDLEDATNLLLHLMLHYFKDEDDEYLISEEEDAALIDDLTLDSIHQFMSAWHEVNGKKPDEEELKNG